MGRVNARIYLNGEIVDAEDARLPAVSSAAFYGKGVFTTLAIYRGLPFLWEKHWRRLSDNAATVGLDLSENTERVTREALDEIIAKNGVDNGRARITFLDETPSAIWATSRERKTSLSIVTGDLRPIPQPLRLSLSPYPVNSRSPLAGVKSCNYLENLMTYDEAKQRGFDESVRVNEKGHITSAAMANVFWLKDGRLLTPAVSTGCLPGTTREFVLENIESEEVEADINQLQNADAIFLTSAGLGVAAVAHFDAKKLKTSDHPILDLLPKDA
jgi:branched-chain amino acid aminotransferase